MFRSCFCSSQAYSAAPLRNFHKFRRRGDFFPRSGRNARPRERPDAQTPHVQRPPAGLEKARPTAQMDAYHL